MYKLPFLENGVKLPSFVIEERHLKRLKLPASCSDYDFLRALTLEGFNKLKLKRGSDKYNEYVARIKKELDTFKELGFCSYLLLTWDIMNFCRENNIATGYGRGSACGSEVLTLIGVTRVDAIANELFFERFLSKFRAKFKEIDGDRYYQGDLLLDIDLDIEFKERERVVKYVEERYPLRVCKLLTTSTLTTKILVKDICKIYLEFSEDEAKRVSDMIPKVAGFVKSLDEARKENKEFDEFCNEHPDFYDICSSLSDLHNNFGCHPSAVIISSQPLDEFMPLQLSESDEEITAFAMTDVSNMAPKVDLLGLRCATLLNECCKKLGTVPENIDIHHESIYQGLQDLQYPRGLFQIEADTNFQVLRKVKPKSLDHLSAVLSLARPGAIQFSGIYSKYVETGEAQSVHPLFDDILKESAGIPIYQESLMKCANRVGFTLDESETLRRIVGKKKKEEMPEWQKKVEDKIKENGLDPKAGEVLWSILEASASYSFNKSHAAAYASMCAATCYLKFNHPQVFYETLLNLAKDEPDSIGEIRIIANEMSCMGIRLLPPDVTKSGKDFSIEGKDIRFGLSNMRGISAANIDKLVSFRREFANKFELFSATQDAKISIAILCSLIMSGAIPSNGISRAKLALEAQTYNLLTPRETLLVRKLAAEYNDDLLVMLKDLGTKSDENGKRYIKDSRLVTLRRDFAPYEQMYRENSRNEDLCIHLHERHLLGFSYSSTIKSIYSKKVEGLMDISHVLTEQPNIKILFVGFITEVKKAISIKSKKAYVKFEVSDETGRIKVMLHGEESIASVQQFHGCLPDIDDIVIIGGSKGSGDMTFVSPGRKGESMIIQTNVVKLSKRDLTVDI